MPSQDPLYMLSLTIDAREAFQREIEYARILSRQKEIELAQFCRHQREIELQVELKHRQLWYEKARLFDHLIDIVNYSY